MQTKAVGARGSTSSRPPAAFGSLRWRAGPHARPVRGVGPRDAEANGPTATCYTEAMRGLSLLGLALPAGCSAAGGDLEASLDGGAPALALGTGEAAFEPVAEGGELELVHGPQGGWHVVGAVRMGGFAPDGTVLTYTVRDGATPLVEVPIALRTSRLVRDGAGYLKLGDLLIFPITGPADVVGHAVTIEARVTRDGAELAAATLDATIVDRR